MGFNLREEGLLGRQVLANGLDDECSGTTGGFEVVMRRNPCQGGIHLVGRKKPDAHELFQVVPHPSQQGVASWRRVIESMDANPLARKSLDDAVSHGPQTQD